MHVLLCCLALLAADEKAGAKHYPLTVTGRALDSDGQSIPGARMSATGPRAGSASSSGSADQEGKLTLKLPPGRYSLRGRAPRRSAEVMCIQTFAELVVGDAPEQTATFEFEPGCRIVLKAVDGKTGKAILGVPFWHRDDQNRHTRLQTNAWFIDDPTTNDKGELRAIVAPGIYRFGVSGSALPEGLQAQAGDLADGQEVELKAGQETTAKFQLSRLP